MKILNLFAGIGGNRTLWGDKHKITAVDDSIECKNIYEERFPNDHFLLVDAYDFLQRHYEEFDFIWASPPCPTHSKLMYCQPHHKRRLPDLRLYSIILFLKSFYHGFWVVENVESYYTPLIKPTAKVGRHLFWANFPIKPKKFKRLYPHTISNIKMLKEENQAQDVPLYKGTNERKILRNMVNPEIGKYIFDSIKTTTLEKFIK